MRRRQSHDLAPKYIKNYLLYDDIDSLRKYLHGKDPVILDKVIKCDVPYSVIAFAARCNAKKCFDWLYNMGLDINDRIMHVDLRRRLVHGVFDGMFIAPHTISKHVFNIIMNDNRLRLDDRKILKCYRVVCNSGNLVKKLLVRGGYVDLPVDKPALHYFHKLVTLSNKPDLTGESDKYLVRCCNSRYITRYNRMVPYLHEIINRGLMRSLNNSNPDEAQIAIGNLISFINENIVLMLLAGGIPLKYNAMYKIDRCDSYLESFIEGVMKLRRKSTDGGRLFRCFNNIVPSKDLYMRAKYGLDISEHDVFDAIRKRKMTYNAIDMLTYAGIYKKELNIDMCIQPYDMSIREAVERAYNNDLKNAFEIYQRCMQVESPKTTYDHRSGTYS